MARHALVALELCTFLAAASTADAAQKRRAPRPSPVVRVTATAYCDQGRTKSGELARPGTIAADPRLFPLGTVIRVVEPRAFRGLYTVTDTGSAVKGRKIDIFMKSCARAETFGRQTMRVRVVRGETGSSESAGRRRSGAASTRRP